MGICPPSDTLRKTIRMLNMLKTINISLRSIFQRPDNNNKPLDGLRAIAITFVVLFHSFFFTQYAFAEKHEFLTFIDGIPFWLNWVWQGDKGVDIFFVISGFLIAQQLMQECHRTDGLNFRVFYLKRACRIFPLYLFAILLFGLTGTGNAEYFWANLLLLNNVISVEKIFIPWSWSLTIELQFYLLMPFFLMFLYRSGRPVIILVLLFFASILLRMWLLLDDPQLYTKTLIDMLLTDDKEAAINYLDTLYVNLYSRCGPLLLGVLAAHVNTHHGVRLKDYFARNIWFLNTLFLLSLLLIAGVTMIPVYVASDSPAYHPLLHFLYISLGRNLFALGVALFMLTALYRAGLGCISYRFLAARFWFPISQTSYAIYMFHIPFLFVAFYILQGGEKIHSIQAGEVVMVAVLGLLLSAIFSSLTYIFIERPAQSWGRVQLLPAAA